MEIVPLVGVNIPVIRFNNVVFPHPLGPSMNICSFCLMRMLGKLILVSMFLS